MPSTKLRMIDADERRLISGRCSDGDALDHVRLQRETDQALVAISNLAHDLREQLDAATTALDQKMEEVAQLTKIAEAQRQHAGQARIASANAVERADSLSKLLELRTREVAVARAEAAASLKERDRLIIAVAEAHQRPERMSEIEMLPEVINPDEAVTAEAERLREANATVLAISEQNSTLVSEHELLSNRLLDLEERNRDAHEALSRREVQLSVLESRLHKTSQCVDDLLASTSWRVTSPMRAIKNFYLGMTTVKRYLLPSKQVENGAAPSQAVNS